jgi:oligopeptide/dipeptide ABC transporter ATP-binding protein
LEITTKTKTDDLLVVKNLSKKFLLKKHKMPWQRKAYVQVINGIDFSVKKGEALGLVGESGCGKSTVAKLIMNIYAPTSGSIVYDAQELSSLKGEEKKRTRRNIQYIFQDPMGALNPRIPVIEQIYEPLIIHYGRNIREYHLKSVSLLESVGLKESHGKMYPHQLSGGQRQRVVIARAMILDPDFLICDEPISALDVSIQSQVVNLFMKIRKERGITLLFISHDLSMVRHLCDNTAVMYMGTVVEYGKNETLFGDPLHPYTKALIAAIPIPDPRVKREQIILEGEIPSLLHPPPGCRFHPRCPVVRAECLEKQPELLTLPDGRKVACFAVKGGRDNE